MKNTLWIALVIIVVVGAIGFYGWQAQAPTEPVALEGTSVTPAAPTSVPTKAPTASTTPATSVASSEEVTISITDTAFEPATVTVAPNTTVTFVNNGQGPHWPASGPHPVHTALPGFDAKHPLQTGEKYSFTFTKVGTWSFHDHLNDSMTGQVIVK